MKNKYLIVIADYYQEISNGLLDSALSLISKSNSIKIIKVPGVFEIPVTISRNIKKYDAFLALGCVIKGETPHFDFISQASTNAIMDLSINNNKPIGNGILTCLNMKQANARKNKGAEAAEAVFSVSATNHECVSSDPNTARQFVIGYKPSGSAMYAVVATTTVSNTVSFGAAATISANVYQGNVSCDTNTANKFVFAYSDAANSYFGTAKAATISGTSISFGSASIINSGTTYRITISYSNLSPSVFSIAYQDRSNNDNFGLRSGTTSGTTITLGAADILHTGGAGSSGAWAASLPFSSGGKFCLSYANSISSNAGTAIVGTVSATALATNLTATNFVGITDAAISSAATGTVTIKGGISANVTSLTPAAIYYVQGDGTISTVTTAPAVRIGQALSSTSINLEFTA